MEYKGISISQLLPCRLAIFALDSTLVKSCKIKGGLMTNGHILQLSKSLFILYNVGMIWYIEEYAII